ncbi:MAG: hypothetical protein ACYDAO_04470 [Thermoplasmataceae archaeon]
MATRRITVSIDSALYYKIENRAEKVGEPMASYIRHILIDYIDKIEK